MFKHIWVIVALLGGLAGPMPSAAAQQETTLAELGRRLKIELETISVSGVSSGGSIAHQFHVAHSTNLIGVGIVAGGPYHCAQGDVIRGMQTCTLFNAHANCSWMVRPFRSWCQWYYYNGPGEAPAGRPASDAAMEMAQRSVDDTFQANLDIDDPHGIVGDRVIILHGTLDELLPVGVSDALDQYYAKLYERLSGMQPGEGTLRYLKSLPVNHSMPTDNMIGLKVGTDVTDVNIQVGQCTAFGSPYINACRADDCAGSCCPTSASGDCGDPANAQNPRCRACDLGCTKACFAEIDAAGTILRHIYGEPFTNRNDDPNLRVHDWGTLTPPTVQDDCTTQGTVDTRCKWLQERVFAFKQSEAFDSANEISEAVMADKGFVFVPIGCQNGGRCRLHVAFHGCAQGYGFSSGASTSKSLYGGRNGWTHFVENAGYNEWADVNNIVVLYPQVAQRQLSDSVSLQYSNPFGCWDQWGYTGPNYHTRGGRQIKAVWKMIQALAPELGQ
jgi:poly(3-hydroxybutyrate) depolymerase